MADIVTHLGVGLALSAHAESLGVKATIITASVLPDLGDLPLWRYAAHTSQRLFRARKAKKRKSRHLRGQRALSTWYRLVVFFRNLYGPFHRKKHVPENILRLYHALHSLLIPLLAILLALLGSWLWTMSVWRHYLMGLASALFIHQLLDYFTHEGRWAIRALWPLRPKLAVALPYQYNWWEGTYARYVPPTVLALSTPYALIGLYYPEFFYLLY